MRSLIAHLHKEYRSHRVGLWVLLALVPVVGATLRLLFDFVLCAGGADTTGNLPFYEAFVHFTLATVVVLFAPAVVAAEPTRGAQVFSFRLPRGPSLAFWSKLAFLIALLAVFAALAHLVANVCIVTAGGLWVELRGMGWYFAAWCGMAYVPAALWLVAVACWLPRGGFAVPAFGLLVPVLLLPSVLVVGGDFRLLRSVTATIPIALAVQCAFCLVVAWMSFVRARRFGNGPKSAFLHGGSLVLLGSLALSAWVAREARRVGAIDPEQSLRVLTAMLDPTGRYVYANACQKGPLLGVVIDLQSGTAERMGPPDAEFMGGGPLVSRPAVLCLARSEAFTSPRDLINFAEELTYVDTAERRVVHSCPMRLLAEYPNPMLLGPEHGTTRSGTPLRTPDGRRVWVFRDRLEVEQDGGYERLPWEPDNYAFSPVGFGFVFGARHGYHVYDLTRRRSFPCPGKQYQRGGCWVLRDAWLVGEAKDKGTQRTWHDWRLRDPETGVESPAPGMRDRDEVATMLDDGKVLVVGASRQGDDVWIVDTTSGTRMQIAIPGLVTSSRNALLSLSDPGGLSPERTGDGRRVLGGALGRSSFITSYVPGTTALTPPVFGGRIVAGEEGATVLAIGDGGWLVHIDLDTGERRAVLRR